MGRFRDTSSAELNPVMQFTMLFGLLAVALAVVFFLLLMIFVWRPFYGVRVGSVEGA